jgi:hypothetical protein
MKYVCRTKYSEPGPLKERNRDFANNVRCPSGFGQSLKTASAG